MDPRECTIFTNETLSDDGYTVLQSDCSCCGDNGGYSYLVDLHDAVASFCKDVERTMENQARLRLQIWWDLRQELETPWPRETREADIGMPLETRWPGVRIRAPPESIFHIECVTPLRGSGGVLSVVK